MIKLIVDNSYCQVEGLDPVQFGQLKELMSYKVENYAAESRGYCPQKRSLLSKRGAFATGLKYVFDNYAKLHRLKIEISDRRGAAPPSDPTAYNLTLGFNPYLEQLEAAEACKQHGRGVCVAPTGAGKSVIIALIISKIKVPTLLVVPSLELKRQLSQFISSVIKGGLITVANIDSLSTDDDYSKYKALICDEFHHAASRTYRELNKKAWKHIYYRFGISATPFRSNDNERLLLESFLSNVIYEIPYSTAVAKNYIVPLESYYCEVPISYPDGYTWAQVYSELIVHNETRNELIATLLDKLQDKATLCLVKEIRHGEILSEMSGLPFVNGQDNLSKDLITKFNRGEIKQLIGTEGVLGEGVDTKPCEYVIIAGLGKSRPALMQKIGRSFRVFGDKVSAKVILFKDKSHKFTINHYNAQRKTLKEEYGAIPVKLTIDIGD